MPLCLNPPCDAAVFIGEVDEGKVVGFHNWIQFHFEERAGRANYLGHLLPRGRQGSTTLDTQTVSDAYRHCRRALRCRARETTLLMAVVLYQKTCSSVTSCVPL